MVYQKLQSAKLRGEIELDESLFGTKVKYHKGNPRGQKVWIFGLVERSPKTLLLFPGSRCDGQTLVTIIKIFVEPGSTIFSDGWAA